MLFGKHSDTCPKTGEMTVINIQMYL